MFSGNEVGRRLSHNMEITPSRWQWKKTKDLLHFYTLLGLIPVGAIIFYSNVYIGPATLTPIPEGYTPKHWEYHKVLALSGISSGIYLLWMVAFKYARSQNLVLKHRRYIFIINCILNNRVSSHEGIRVLDDVKKYKKVFVYSLT